MKSKGFFLTAKKGGDYNMKKAHMILAVLLGVCLLSQGSAMAETVMGTVKDRPDPITGMVMLSVTGEDGIAKDVEVKASNAAELLVLTAGDSVKAEGEPDASGTWVATTIEKVPAEHPGAPAEQKEAPAEHPGTAAGQ